MNKLLKANFFRLKKDIIFWLFLFITLGTICFTLFRYYIIIDNAILVNSINEFIKIIGLFIAIFVSIFIGKEYSNGIIRNKVIVRT